jgi:acetoin utilization protein AcuB
MSFTLCLLKQEMHSNFERRIFMSSNTEIQSVMTKSVHSVGPDQTLAVAQELMKKHAIRHLPVRHEGRIVGLLSERDIDFALRVDKSTPEDLRVEDALTTDVFTVLPNASLRSVAKEMGAQKIGCAIIEDEHGKLLGIFTAVDACRVLGEMDY